MIDKSKVPRSGRGAARKLEAKRALLEKDIKALLERHHLYDENVKVTIAGDHHLQISGHARLLRKEERQPNEPVSDDEMEPHKPGA